NAGAVPLVGNQAFADAVLFSTRAQAYYSDNVADLGLQADLDGRIWFLTGSDLNATPYIGIDANAATIAPGATLPSRTVQPLYYPPAVRGYGWGSRGCLLSAFGSGSFYEKSALVSGTGIGAGPSSFSPSLFLAVNTKPLMGSVAPAIASGSPQVVQVPISGT